MKRVDLEHIIRAAGSIVDSRQTVMLRHRLVQDPAILSVLPELKEPQGSLVRARLECCLRRVSQSDT